MRKRNFIPKQDCQSTLKDVNQVPNGKVHCRGDSCTLKCNRDYDVYGGAQKEWLAQKKFFFVGRKLEFSSFHILIFGIFRQSLVSFFYFSD